MILRVLEPQHRKLNIHHVSIMQFNLFTISKYLETGEGDTPEVKVPNCMCFGGNTK